MIAPSYMLLVLGILGAADIHFFHGKAHAIRKHGPARTELFTHFLRGPTYFFLFLLLPNFSFSGWALAGLYGLFVVDVGISIADFWVEPDSRRDLGGLPRGEYLIHVLMAMVFGAMVAAVVYLSGSAIDGPTSLVWIRDGAWIPIRVALALMAPLVLVSGLADLLAMRRLARQAG